MQFGSIHYLLLLWLTPALVFFYLYAGLRRQRRIRVFCGPDLHERLTSSLLSGRRRLKAVLIVAAVVFLVLAMAHPRWGYHWEDVKRVGVDIIVAVDVSRSMLAEDIPPSRLERARRKLQDFTAMLDGDRVGLVAFAGTSFLQCPLTLDYGAFSMFLEHLSPDMIPVPGTDMAAAIRTATRAFNRKERTSKALILITDGEDHAGDVMQAAREARREGVRIFVIGIGTPDGTPVPGVDGKGGFMQDRSGSLVLSRLDENTLQKIALETDGAYVRSVTGDLDLETIYHGAIKKDIEEKELSAARRKRWEERFQWFAALALLCLVLEFFIRENRRKRATASD
jgi:Ca-activated chloride channel family protein